MEVVMEGAHDACDLKRTDRLMIAVVGVNVAAGLVIVSVLRRPEERASTDGRRTTPAPP
jgi:hypothetical protein